MVCESPKADLGIALLAAALGVHGAGLEPDLNGNDVGVEGLSEWLTVLKLSHYAGAAQAWCKEAGAVSLSEGLEVWEDFADGLELKPLERKRIEKHLAEQAPPERPHEASPTHVSTAPVVEPV